MPVNCGSCAVPVSDVTDRVADALSEVGDSIQRLQGLIAPLILEAAARNPSHLRELQELDHACQKIGNLADFVAALALVLPDDWRLDPTVASRVLTMADLSARLGFAAEGERGHASGDLELF